MGDFFDDAVNHRIEFLIATEGGVKGALRRLEQKEGYYGYGRLDAVDERTRQELRKQVGLSHYRHDPGRYG